MYKSRTCVSKKKNSKTTNGKSMKKKKQQNFSSGDAGRCRKEFLRRNDGASRACRLCPRRGQVSVQQSTEIINAVRLLKFEKTNRALETTEAIKVIFIFLVLFKRLLASTTRPDPIYVRKITKKLTTPKRKLHKIFTSCDLYKTSY